MDWQQRDGVHWLSARLEGAQVAFSTRLGGESEGPFASLNLGLATGDRAEVVYANRLRLARAVNRDPDGVLIGHQIHEAVLIARDEPPRRNPFTDPGGGPPPPSDGQLTTNAALTPAVQVADCLPVALAGPRGLAMLHCGWRGLAAGIVARGVAATGASGAAVGPGIGPCCYEVGDQVLAAFEPLGEGVANGRRLDLREVTRRLLIAAGVAAGRIESSFLCTSCDERFFSHRRDGGRTGRQAGLVWCADA
jgi:YfiH family protein